jgi:hypothetical protein
MSVGISSTSLPAMTARCVTSAMVILPSTPFMSSASVTNRPWKPSRPRSRSVMMRGLSVAGSDDVSRPGSCP